MSDIELQELLAVAHLTPNIAPASRKAPLASVLHEGGKHTPEQVCTDGMNFESFVILGELLVV